MPSPRRCDFSFAFSRWANARRGAGNSASSDAILYASIGTRTGHTDAQEHSYWLLLSSAISLRDYCCTLQCYCDLRVKRNTEGTFPCPVIVFLRTIAQNQYRQFIWKQEKEIDWFVFLFVLNKLAGLMSHKCSRAGPVA